ncbi:MAG: sensor histidine kinase [Gaiellaceae bacterium]
MSPDEAERALVAERIIAEQEERRRLAELLHDGPVQQFSAIAQMLDAALDAVGAGEKERAEDILTRGLELARTASRDLRALCDDLEPRTLRELGFATAVEALARRITATREIEFTLDLDHAEELGDNALIALYQILREAIDQASRRGSPTRIEVSLQPTPSKGAVLVVSDDGLPERRSAVLEALAERAATLNARFSADVHESRGSTIRIDLPPSAARR